jgi:hypothetical protein
MDAAAVLGWFANLGAQGNVPTAWTLRVGYLGRPFPSVKDGSTSVQVLRIS